MYLHCDACERYFQLSSEQEKAGKFECPSCSKKLTPISGSVPKGVAPASESFLEDDGLPIKPEIFANTNPSVFICVRSSATLLQDIHAFYKTLNYNISVPNSLKEARDRLYTGVYRTVILEENDGMKDLFAYMARLPGVARRQVNLITFSSTAITMHPFDSFRRSANYCINLNDAVKDLKKLLRACEDGFATENVYYDAAYAEFMSRKKDIMVSGGGK